MQIEFKISEVMSKNENQSENRKMRMPRELREVFDLEIGQYITLRGENNELITLRIDFCYGVDLMGNDAVAYVTESTMKRVNTGYRDIKTGDIKIVTGITLGCDPECYVIDTVDGSIISANRFFNKFGEIGFDGLMVEFRPPPSTDEFVVAKNLADEIRRAVEIIHQHPYFGNRAKLVAASNISNVLAGFHLHFGIPMQLINGTIEVHRTTVQFVRALDYYVAIPAMIAEGDNDFVRRCQVYNNYGKPGNYRLDNNITLEYRVPGGALLKHPAYTVGLLGLGMLVIEDIVSRLKVCTDNFENLKEVVTDEDLNALYPNLPCSEEIRKIVMSPSTERAREHLNKIRKDVQYMVSYEKRKKSVEPFLDCIANNTNFTNDMEQNWRFYA